MFSTTFEKKTFLPKKYQITMKGLLHFDQREFEVRMYSVNKNSELELTNNTGSFRISYAPIRHTRIHRTYFREPRQVWYRMFKNEWEGRLHTGTSLLPQPSTRTENPKRHGTPTCSHRPNKRHGGILLFSWATRTHPASHLRNAHRPRPPTLNARNDRRPRN